MTGVTICPLTSFKSLVIFCAYVCTGPTNVVNKCGKKVEAKMLEAVAEHKVHV